MNEEVTKFAYPALLALNSLSPAIKMLSTFLVQEGYLHMGDLFPASGGQRRIRVSFLHWLFLK